MKHDAATECEAPILNRTEKIDIKQTFERKPRLVDMLEYDKQLLTHQQIGEPC